jgi:molecular chaperone HtpG
MPEGEEEILYMVGESREMVENSPYMEPFKEKDREVLIMTDPVDELVVSSLMDYKGRKLKAIDKGSLEEEEDGELAEARKRYGKLLSFLGTKLKGVKEVRLSSRLKESASCLVGEEGSMGAQMERIMREMGQTPPEQEKVLELNPRHPAVEKMYALYEEDRQDPRVEDYGRIFHDQAVLAAGGKLKDPAAFAARVNELLAGA